MSNNSPIYTITAANADLDSERILGLWKRGLTHAGMPEAKFDWYYRKNPDGQPQVFFLHVAGEPAPVGVAAIATRHMHIGTKLLATGELIDFVALPEYRTLFPALFLQKEIRRIALETNRTHTLLYGLPNPKSLAVVKRIGYQLVGQMVRRVRMLRSAGYLSRHMPMWISRIIGSIIDRIRLGALALQNITHPKFQRQWIDRPDARFDALWQKVKTHDGTQRVLIGVRDSAFLTWRFAECPLKTYRFFTLSSAVDNRLIAYAACAVGGESLEVHDFLVDTTEHGAGKALWRALSADAFHRGHSNISVEFLGAESIQNELEAAGMMKRQERPLYATDSATSIPDTLSVNTHDQTTLLQESRWYLTCADEDG
jgi:ribosomal protein S18 acetylase RimI-like enzyme